MPVEERLEIDRPARADAQRIHSRVEVREPPDEVNPSDLENVLDPDRHFSIGRSAELLREIRNEHGFLVAGTDGSIGDASCCDEAPFQFFDERKAVEEQAFPVLLDQSADIPV